MSADYVDYHYIKDSEGTLMRCVRAEFTNLTVTINHVPHHHLHITEKDFSFGHPGIIVDSGEKRVRNVLMYCERRFNTETELEVDLKKRPM